MKYLDDRTKTEREYLAEQAAFENKRRQDGWSQNIPECS